MDDERALAILNKLADQMGSVWRSELGMNSVVEHIRNRLNQAKLLEAKLESMDGDLQSLQDECDTVRYNKERIEEENKELRDLCQKLQTQVVPVQQEYDYRVTRTHDDYTDSKGTKDLDEYFNAGYEFVHASEFIRGDHSNNYIEYIVRKKRSIQHEKN